MRNNHTMFATADGLFSSFIFKSIQIEPNKQKYIN
jgi:hypothetical protein